MGIIRFVRLRGKSIVRESVRESKLNLRTIFCLYPRVVYTEIASRNIFSRLIKTADALNILRYVIRIHYYIVLCIYIIKIFSGALLANVCS